MRICSVGRQRSVVSAGRARLIKAFLSLFVLPLLLMSGNAVACSCRQLPNDIHEVISQMMQEVDVIFLGSVLNIHKEDGIPVETVRILIRRLWKGDVGGVLTFKEESGSSCGSTFEVGHIYLVFASLDGGIYGAGSCGPTSKLEYAQEYIDAVGHPTWIVAPSESERLRIEEDVYQARLAKERRERPDLREESNHRHKQLLPDEIPDSYLGTWRIDIDRYMYHIVPNRSEPFVTECQKRADNIEIEIRPGATSVTFTPGRIQWHNPGKRTPILSYDLIGGNSNWLIQYQEDNKELFLDIRPIDCGLSMTFTSCEDEVCEGDENKPMFFVPVVD